MALGRWASALSPARTPAQCMGSPRRDGGRAGGEPSERGLVPGAAGVGSGSCGGWPDPALPCSAIHLCNNSIQKHLKNDRGRNPLLPQHNMWTSSQFQEYLQQRGQGSAWGSVIYPSMKRAVAYTMQMAQGRVEPRRNSFELYGADFVLGHDFRPWLLEINSSPTMHASTPVTAQLCAQVQEDVIRVVVGRRDGRCCDVGNFELLWRQVGVLGWDPGWGSNSCASCPGKPHKVPALPGREDRGPGASWGPPHTNQAKRSLQTAWGLT